MCAISVLWLLVVALNEFGEVVPARILFVVPPLQSQCGMVATLGKELVSRGHDVVAYLPIQFDADTCFTGTHVRVVTYDMGNDNWDILNSVRTGPISLSSMGQMINAVCRGMFIGQEDHINNLRKYNFDLVIVNLFRAIRCSVIIPHTLGIPYISLTASQFPWEMGKPFLPNIEPHLLTDFPNDMTFIQRLRNTVIGLVLPIMDPLFMIQPIEMEILPSGKTYTMLASSPQVFISDASFLLTGAVPEQPNILNLGGFSTKTPKKLPDVIDKFVSRTRKGVILVSFGSVMLDASVLTAVAIEHVSQQLQEYSFVWKTGSKSQDINILRTKWVPQNDVLGHNMTKLFISHCGRNSWYEALYHAVPLLCVPCYGDQFFNAAVAQRNGWGLTISNSDVTPEKLMALVDSLLTNESFSQNIRRGSKLYRDIYREPAGKVAARWIEHVIQYGGKHFRPATFDLSFISLIMWDVWFVLIGGASVMCFMIVFCTRKACSKISDKCGRKKKSD